MVHPKVREEYEKNKVPIPYNANDVNETEFFQQTLPDTRKVAVNHIIRTLRGEKEYIISDETITGKTLEGNNRQLNKQFGKLSLPRFVMAYDPATGRNQATGRISEWEQRYEIPSSPQALKKLFAKDQMGTHTAMTVDLGEGAQFTVSNRNDFINLPIDKLVAKVTGKNIESISGAPEPFVTSSSDEEGTRGKLTNSQQEQEEARRRMYDFTSLVTNSSGTFGPTEEQRAAAQPTLAPQPALNVAPSITNEPVTAEQREQQQQEQVKIEQQQQKDGEPKKAVGQSKATNKVNEDVGVVLKNEDTGVKQNMTKDSITIEEPQGQAAKKQRDRDEEERDQLRRR